MMDKTTWGDGPWQHEQDRLEWKTASGYPGLILRSERLGCLNGYVALPPWHKLHGKHHNEIEVDVHGGLTWSGLKDNEKPPDAWWLGFDCAHCYDVCPAMEAYLESVLGYTRQRRSDETYRTIEYVIIEVEALSERLKEME